ncbi:MAG: alkaline phosphatase [Planctomycetaceae bacterium]|nr:alkaline phosphatase [Planctomycetaceae bacterium]
MKRREFFSHSALGTVSFGWLAGASAGQPLLEPSLGTVSKSRRTDLGLFASHFERLGKKPKNIIFVVSDGMSAGTLQLAELFANVKFGRQTCWGQLCQQEGVSRAWMETYSANSWVTDSAAASSSWGGGIRVNNGSLNVGPKGERPTPILQKFKQSGFSVGCVTSVPITHATPAGFCVNHPTRDEQAKIAEMFLPLRFDCLLGGGLEFFQAESREDKQPLLEMFRQQSYEVLTSKAGMNEVTDNNQPVLGCFYKSGIPYAMDHAQDESLVKSVPSLADMSEFAMKRMAKNPNGFVLQIEGGKVDWAAHANDTAGLIGDQLALDEALQVALDFARESQDTLVIVTTDHGNANPGLIGTSGATKKFETLVNARHTNAWIMEGLRFNWSIDEIRQRVQYAQGVELSVEEATILYEHIAQLSESQRGEPKKMPFAKLAQMQKLRTGIGWAGDDHSADYVELTMFGPGSELLPQFVKNTDLHSFMLAVTELIDLP